MHIVSQNGHSSIVESLIICGADVHAVNKVCKNVLITLHRIVLYYYLGSIHSIAYCFTKWS